MNATKKLDEGEASEQDGIRVDVWHAAASHETFGHWESACEQLLVPEEVKNADRFRRTTTRNQHVVGRAMARRLLGDVQVHPHEIQFGTGEHGKPYVVSPPNAVQPFNVAHTDGLVLCGVADQRIELLGVDVEAVNRKTSTELAERYFSEPEVNFLRRQTTDSQQQCFLKIWTLKEAYIKAIGTGLHTPLCDFAFRELDSDQPKIDFLSDQLQDDRDWRFVCFEPRDGYIASAALVVGAGACGGGGGGQQPRETAAVHWRPFEPMMES